MKAMKGNSRKIKWKTEAQSIPVNTADTNATGDKLSIALLMALLAAAAGTLGGGLYWSITGFTAAVAHTPVNWVGCLWMVVVLAASILLARSLAWLSIFGSVLLGSRMGAWKTLESTTRYGMKLRKLFPGGVPWLTTALVQSLVNRGQYKDALAVAEGEWTRCGQDDRQAQNLGTLCFVAGLANQAEGEIKQSLVWNDRAIGILNKTLEQLLKPQKGFMDKLAGAQSGQVLGQLRIQLAAAYFNNATIHFNSQDYRRAKENYKHAVENAVKAPDFPQKSDIIKFGNEQLGRLKHT